MSEYQYYEFQAVDRLLTQDQMDELRKFSTRADITPSSFVNVYEWGDFKGDPDKWMEKYFDAFLYLANWGTRRLMFRVPIRLLDPDVVSEYCADEILSFRTKGENLILSFDSEEEDSDWAEGEGWLGALILLRSDLMQGDLRCLYLGWLLAVQNGLLEDDADEPPVPPGLAVLSGPLQNLAEFLRIDPDLIRVAAENSNETPAQTVSPEDIKKWLAGLPAEDKDAVLLRLIESNDMHGGVELRLRAVTEIRGKMDTGRELQTGNRRHVGQLVARAEATAEERRRREVERQAREKAEQERRAAEQRENHLQALIGKEASLWTKVARLISTRQPKEYDDAVLLLQDLRDLAGRQDSDKEFTHRMTALYQEHARKPSLIKKFRNANL